MSRTSSFLHHHQPSSTKSVQRSSTTFPRTTTGTTNTPAASRTILIMLLLSIAKSSQSVSSSSPVWRRTLRLTPRTTNRAFSRSTLFRNNRWNHSTSTTTAFLNGRIHTVGSRCTTSNNLYNRSLQPAITTTTTTQRNLSTDTDYFFAPSDQYPNFQSLGIRSPILLQRIQTFLSSPNAPPPRPSMVQSSSYQLLSSPTTLDVTIGAETGSGKTLAYLLPILDDILMRKQEGKGLGYDYARAIILVPNKELVNQVLKMAMCLSGGPDSFVWRGSSSPGGYLSDDPDTPTTTTTTTTDTDTEVDPKEIVRLGLFPGNLKLLEDYRPFRLTNLSPLQNPPLDIIITTPAALGPLGLNPKNINLFADVQTLIIDEADMLLDGGYLRPLENVLMGFRRADRLIAAQTPEEEEEEEKEDGGGGVGFFGPRKTQHVLVAATLPDMGLKSVDAYVKKKFPLAESVTLGGMHNARHGGLRESTVWIDDDDDGDESDGGGGGGTNRKRLEKLITMLRTTPEEASSDTNGSTAVGLKGETVMLFLNSVDDVDGASNALRRAGINALPYHAKIPLGDRTRHLESFRSFVAAPSTDRSSSSDTDTKEEEGVVLVCTDLAARGLDVPGVTAVVQLQFAGNVVAHLHRMGRCGRAGNRDGRGVVFYGGRERELVRVVQEAEKRQEKMVLEGSEVEFREEGDDGVGVGKVDAAFSRKRGFTKKRKKMRRSRGMGDEE